MKTKLALLAVLIASFFTSNLQAENKKVYTVGIVPQFEIRHLRKIWNPILNEIEKKTGYKLKLIGSPTIPDFGKELLKGQFDFAYMNPYQTIISHKAQGYKPLVRDIGRKLQGIIVVRKDSNIKSIYDLKDKKVAFPSANALGASLLLRADIKEKYNIDINPVYVKTHSSVYLNVIVKQTQAGGGVKKTLDQQKTNIKNTLRILHYSPKVVPHSLSVHPRVPKKIQQRIKNAFLELGKSEAGKSLLSKIPMKIIGPATIKEYDPLKKMHLEKFYVR